jgi:DNA-binding LytR/AlgR family response regulator
MNLNCMVVDDDDMSRTIIKRYIEKTNFLSLNYECTSAIDASNLLKEGNTDVIFLDIQMPEMTGMDLIKTLEEDYQIVMITSAQEYAVEAFEKQVTDYLVKPIEYSRFLMSASKVKKNVENLQRQNEKHHDIYVRSDSKLVRIDIENIIYVEALADYVIFHTKDKKHIVHYTMKGIENRLPTSMFSRVHRSYIINLFHVGCIEDNSILIGEKLIPIGASYKEMFINRLNFL